MGQVRAVWFMNVNASKSEKTAVQLSVGNYLEDSTLFRLSLLVRIATEEK